MPETLEELISQCGERFCLFENDGVWVAGIADESGADMPEVGAVGTTPRAAVLKLLDELEN